MKAKINEARLNRATIWLYYYLGVTDGISAALESFNPKPSKDAKWRVEFRNYLPPELAALRQPNANLGPASSLIEREVVEALQKLKQQSHKKN